jgi:hypothetical protein
VTISDRTRVLIMVLSRTADIAPQLAHDVRVRTNQGITHGEASQIITALKAAQPE